MGKSREERLRALRDDLRAVASETPSIEAAKAVTDTASKLDAILAMPETVGLMDAGTHEVRTTLHFRPEGGKPCRSEHWLHVSVPVADGRPRRVWLQRLEDEG